MADSKVRHRATYARDKKNGGYIIRVEGPDATKFADREVPVTKKDGEVTKETLTALIWTGIDSDSAKPVALYHFAPKPKDDMNDEIPF